MTTSRRGRGRAVDQRERQQAIRDFVGEAGHRTVDEIAEHTGVSSMTVYRDLAELEGLGLLRLSKGVVTAAASNLHEAASRYRLTQQVAEKQALARAALELQHATDLQIAAQKETIAAAAAGSAGAEQAAKLLALATSAQPAPRRVIDGVLAGASLPDAADQTPGDQGDQGDAGQADGADSVSAAEKALDAARTAVEAATRATGGARTARGATGPKRGARTGPDGDTGGTGGTGKGTDPDSPQGDATPGPDENRK